MPMRNLTIIVATADELRFRSALGLALSTRALAGDVRLFLDTAATELVRPPITGEHDAAHGAVGLPGLAELLDEALEAGVTMSLCQAGMAMAGLSAEALDPRLGYGGMVSMLAAIDEDQLVVV
jgi:predicted peroxiredoxin